MKGKELALGLLGGWVLDQLLGDPVRFHPVAGLGKVASALERRLWRRSRIAGGVLVALIILPLAALTELAARLAFARPWLGMILTAALTWAALGGRGLARAGKRMAFLLQEGDLEAARSLAPSLVGRDPKGLGREELARAAVESVAENTADAVLGALLWGALMGPVGVAVYRAANTLDAMFGHPDARYEKFGTAAARLDDLLTWPASRLGALLAVLLSPLVGGEPGKALAILARDGGKHPSPNAGRMEAAFAGALGVRLGGLNRYGERVEFRPHLGEGPLPGPREVALAVRLSQAVGAAGVFLSALLAWALRA